MLSCQIIKIHIVMKGSEIFNYPQPLPHLQPEPQLQFPPQLDIFFQPNNYFLKSLIINFIDVVALIVRLVVPIYRAISIFFYGSTN